MVNGSKADFGPTRVVMQVMVQKQTHTINSVNEYICRGSKYESIKTSRKLEDYMGS